MKESVQFLVHGRRWFDKKGGNTYHSVVVRDNQQNLIAKCDYEYGYGEQYLQTACELLVKAGKIPEIPGLLSSGAEAQWYDFEMNYVRTGKVYRTVEDVNRKKDL